MGVSIKVNNTTLPSPVEMTVNDEIIWSAATGRDESGDMQGEVITTKGTWTIRWGVLTETELTTIRTYLVSGFFTVKITIGSTTSTVTTYRSTLTSEVLGTFAGTTYYKSVSVSLIQQ